MIARTWKLVVGMVVVTAGQAGAAQFSCPDASGNGSVTVAAGRVWKNVYAAGMTVAIEAPVRGDLVVAGGRVQVAGPVERDLTAVSGDLSIAYPVGDDARLAGGKIEIGAPVKGDLIAAGGQVRVGEKAPVGGDMALAGGEISIEAPVQGRAWIAGGRVNLNGRVQGDSVVHYDETLELGPRCRLGGKLDCYGPHPPVVDPKAVAPGLQFHIQVTPESGTQHFLHWTGVFGLLALVRFAAWALAAWLLSALAPRPLRAVLGVIETHPTRDLGLGLLILLAGLVSLPLVFLTGIGYYVALTAGSLLAVGLLFARLLAAYYLGLLLRRWADGKREPTTVIPFRWVLLGLLVLHAMGLVPVLGWLISLGLTLVALGGLARLVVQWVRLENQGEARAPEQG